MNCKRISYSLIFILMSSNLLGQTDLKFEYRCNKEFARPILTDIKLKFPNGRTEKLFSDKMRSLEYFKKGFFRKPGNYLLSIRSFGLNSKPVSTVYRFALNGKETEVKIDLSFHYNSKLSNGNGNWIDKQFKTDAFISVIKYYASPKSIELSLEDLKSTDIQSPFLKITNYSKDTIYGEYLPGYFWGSLSIGINDSTWSNKRIGTIDTECADRPPLYPDSSTIATVGTWGYKNQLIKNKYKFELPFTTSWVSRGLSKYKDTDSIKWWAETKEFYRLIYKFEIK